MSFDKLKKQVSEQFAKMANGNILLATAHDRDTIWEKYLLSFPEATRQEHNCNCCKSFIRQAGHVVILDGKTKKRVTLWDLQDVPEEFAASVSALREYVMSLPIAGLFYHTETKNVGVDKNYSDKHKVLFHHFQVPVPKECHKDLAAKSGEMVATVGVFRRGLEELRPDAIDTTLELIAQKSVYNGTPHTGSLKTFQTLQTNWSKLEESKKEAFLWEAAVKQPLSVTRIKNTVIGTLLEDLSEGKSVDQALSAFEKKNAPENYKRPVAVATPRMVEDARKKMEELGMISALSRRKLDTRDLGPSNAIFLHRPKMAPAKDVFDSLVSPASVQAKSLSKCEEIPVDQFLEKVVPSAHQIRVLVENHHLPNFAILTGPADSSAPNLFKWKSSLGWSYTGGLAAASMRDRVRKAGGSVDGVFRFTHTWNWDNSKPNVSLMDLHVFFPGCIHHETGKRRNTRVSGNGRRVGWDCRSDIHSGGKQDVDYTAEAPLGYSPIENITFPSVAKMPEGTYNPSSEDIPNPVKRCALVRRLACIKRNGTGAELANRRAHLLAT